MENSTDSRAELIQANDDIAQDLIPAMIFVALLMVLGIVGNILVCFVFYFRLRMSTQNFLIIALAVFDLLSCFIAMPTEIVDMRYFLMFDNEFACRLLRFMNSYCAFASILTLIVIAVDRYRKVCHPLQPQMSLWHVRVSVVVVLFVALIFAVPAAVLYGIRTTEIENLSIHGHDCSTSDSVKDTVFPLIYNSVLFLLFFVILFALMVIYIRIWREMKRHRLYMARNSVTGKGRSYISSNSEGSCAEVQPSVGRRPSTLPDENANDDVFLQSSQGPQDGQQNDKKKRKGRKELGSSFSENSSVRSDTTLCEADQDVKAVQKTPQGGQQTNAMNVTTDYVQESVKTTEREQAVEQATAALQSVMEVSEVELNVKDERRTEQDVKETNAPKQSVKKVPAVERDVKMVDETEQGATETKAMEQTETEDCGVIPNTKDASAIQQAVEEHSAIQQAVEEHSAIEQSLVGVSGEGQGPKERSNPEQAVETVVQTRCDAPCTRLQNSDTFSDIDDELPLINPASFRSASFWSSTGNINSLAKEHDHVNPNTHAASVHSVSLSSSSIHVNSLTKDTGHVSDLDSSKNAYIVTDKRDCSGDSVNDSSGLTSTLAAFDDTRPPDCRSHNKQTVVSQPERRDEGTLKHSSDVSPTDLENSVVHDGKVKRNTSVSEDLNTPDDRIFVCAANRTILTHLQTSPVESAESSYSNGVASYSATPEDIFHNRSVVVKPSSQPASETVAYVTGNIPTVDNKSTAFRTESASQSSPQTAKSPVRLESNGLLSVDNSIASNGDSSLKPSSETNTESAYRVSNGLLTADAVPDVLNRSLGSQPSSHTRTDSVSCVSGSRNGGTTRAVPCTDAIRSTPQTRKDSVSCVNNSRYGDTTRATPCTDALSRCSRTDSVSGVSHDLPTGAIPKRRVTKNSSVSQVKSHKATVIATSVTVVFFLSFLPHLTLITIRIIDTEFDKNLTGAGLVLYNIFLRSYFINSVSNPIIYGVLNSRFREECLTVFHQIMACRKRCR